MKHWFKALIFCLILLLVLPSTILAQQEPAPEISAGGGSHGLPVRTDSLRQNGDQPHVPASLVKIMTMYVALDQIKAGRASLSDTAVVSERAWRMIGSRMFLEPEEVVTIEQLLTGIAVVSGTMPAWFWPKPWRGARRPSCR